MTIEKHSTVLNYYMDKHILFKANEYSYIEIYEKEQIHLIQALAYYKEIFWQSKEDKDEKFYN